jgi:hypothetical protein
MAGRRKRQAESFICVSVVACWSSQQLLWLLLRFLDEQLSSAARGNSFVYTRGLTVSACGRLRLCACADCGRWHLRGRFSAVSRAGRCIHRHAGISSAYTSCLTISLCLCTCADRR